MNPTKITSTAAAQIEIVLITEIFETFFFFFSGTTFVEVSSEADSLAIIGVTKALSALSVSSLILFKVLAIKSSEHLTSPRFASSACFISASILSR